LGCSELNRSPSHLSSGAGAHLPAPFLLYGNYNTE